MLDIFLYLLLSLSISNVISLEPILYTDISDCKKDEYYDIENFRCTPCTLKTNLIPSENKLTCICNNQSIIKSIDTDFPKCIPCKNGTLPSFDKKICLSITKIQVTKKYSTNIYRLQQICNKNEIVIDKDQNGTYLPEVQCIPCVNGTVTSEMRTSCLDCPIINRWKFKGTKQDECNCPNSTVLSAQTCVPNNLLNDLTRDGDPFQVELMSGENVESLHLKRLLYSSLYLCQEKNSTACQILANLCSLTLYKNSKEFPCAIWFDNKRLYKLPWLFYGEGDAPMVLNRRKITTRYTFNPKLATSWINISSVTYDLNGNFKELKSLNWYLSNFCTEFNTLPSNSGFRFGVNFKLKCNVNLQYFFKNTETEFLNPFLKYTESGDQFLYAIPVLIKNSKYLSQSNDMANWIFVRRFFLTDLFLKSNEKKYFRYIKSLEIVVKIRDKSESGKIFPPYIIIQYEEIDEESLNKNHNLIFNFKITYEMENNITQAIGISLGVLAVFAFLYSGIQSWTQSRRAGKTSIDISTVFRLLIFLSGNLANIFFIVTVGVSLQTFIFYKGQSVVHTLLPDKHTEHLLRDFVIVSFSLKIIEIMTLIIEQISVDIFLIDWEKPRAPNIKTKITSALPYDTKSMEQPVSVWRTCFIANEWNEIQAERKINIILHLILVGFSLEILGIKYWTSSEPELKMAKDDLNINTPHNSCIIAVGFIVFTFFYIVQLVYTVGIYERYIKNRIQDFVDVCSLANISVFILMLDRYGFYIHGRSAHGFADTDMLSMMTQLQREENNLCGHRGLIPNTEEQTFRVIIPAAFRKYYKKLLIPLISSNVSHFQKIISVKNKQTFGKTNIEKSIQAYNTINKFLIAFFEHAIKDLDYEVRSRTLVEVILDVEFNDQIDRAVLYTDNGHSFDKILFYGNELTLMSFDLMLFIFVAVLFSNYLLAVFVTLICNQILVLIRTTGGRKNLAKKTLIDERFLI